MQHTPPRVENPTNTIKHTFVPLLRVEKAIEKIVHKLDVDIQVYSPKPVL